MFTDSLKFESGLKVWLPALSSVAGAEYLKRKISNFVRNAKETDDRGIMQCIQSTGAVIEHTFLDRAEDDKFSLLVKSDTLFSRWVKEANIIINTNKTPIPQIEDVIKTWNEQSDEHNQWDTLDADERVIFTLQCGVGLGLEDR